MTDLMTYTFMDREERLGHIGDIETYLRLLGYAIEESEAIATCAMYAAYLHGCVRIGKDDSPYWHYLHKSTRYGNLQLTTWDDKGPVSDLRVDTPSDFSYIMNGTVKISAEDRESC